MNILTAVPFPLQITVVLCLGLTLGSFVNVCIYRLPKNESVITPRSHCPSCKTQISARDNIPVFSYLLLKGKCRQCTVPIPTLYPIIETLMALLLLAGFIKLGASIKFSIFCVIGPALLIIAIIDIKHLIIPDIVIIPGIVFGLVAGSYLVGLKNSAVGLLVGGGTFLIISQLYYWFRGRVGIGGGDIKFIAAAGALLGWKQVILIIFLGAFFGSLTGIPGLVKKKIAAQSKVPFGAYLSVGTFIAYFSGEHIIHLYTMMITGGY